MLSCFTISDEWKCKRAGDDSPTKDSIRSRWETLKIMGPIFASDEMESAIIEALAGRCSELTVERATYQSALVRYFQQGMNDAFMSRGLAGTGTHKNIECLYEGLSFWERPPVSFEITVIG